jgi:hypothetical protein
LLLSLSATQPAAFTCAVAQGIDVFADEESTPPEELAPRFARFLGLPDGHYPTASRRRLWDIWKTAKLD